MKRIAILGSTGSIGRQTLDVVRRYRDDFTVAALTCSGSVDEMEAQVREFGVGRVAVADPARARELRRRCGAEVLEGLSGITEIAGDGCADLVLNALVGSVGIRPTVAALTAGIDVALANKETLVAAGEPVMALARAKGCAVIPVDSEHSAIFQCTADGTAGDIRRLIITCSGGAFRSRSHEELYHVTPADALRHPRWTMGAKITIDSATLMNKGFEVIEAKMLFDVDYDQIEVLIHPESIVHSLVEFVDRSVLAQLGEPDMRLPIQYALTHPRRRESALAPLDLAAAGTLSFAAPDTDRFPCLAYAYEAGRIGGTMPCVVNAVNEEAVRAFLDGRIGFMDIPRLIRCAMDAHRPASDPCIEEILETDRAVRLEVAGFLVPEGIHA